MQVRDIMTTRVKTVRATATAFEAAELMSLHDVGALPVFEGDALIGILTDRDLVLRCVAPGLDLTKIEVRQVMSRSPVAIDASAPVEEAARRFTDLRIRRMPVLDGQQVVGMLSSDDVARQWDDAPAVLVMVRRLAPVAGSQPPRLPGDCKEGKNMGWYIRGCPICGGDLHDALEEKGWVTCFLCARSFRSAEIRGELVAAGARPVAEAGARESGRRRRVPSKAA